jgi:hypothetical protein
MDNQSYFSLNTIPVLFGKQASEKDKGSFQRSRDAFQYLGPFLTLESYIAIMCHLHCNLATCLTKGEYVMPSRALAGCLNSVMRELALESHTQKKPYMRKRVCYSTRFFPPLRKEGRQGGSFCSKILSNSLVFHP